MRTNIDTTGRSTEGSPPVARCDRGKQEKSVGVFRNHFSTTLSPSLFLSLTELQASDPIGPVSSTGTSAFGGDLSHRGPLHRGNGTLYICTTAGQWTESTVDRG